MRNFSNFVPEGQKPKLLDQVRQILRMRHYSLRTEEAYCQWIRRFILFHNKRHPAKMGGDEITQFLSHLALKRRVSASTQNQALAGLLFLYRQVLEIDLPWLDGVVRAKRTRRLPVVLTPDEVRRGRDSIGPDSPTSVKSCVYVLTLAVTETLVVSLMFYTYTIFYHLVMQFEGNLRATRRPDADLPSSRMKCTREM